MWKVISLFTLLIVAQAADIQDFYGDWIALAFYPAFTDFPMCMHSTFAKNTENVQCTYADGRNASLVELSMSAEIGSISFDYQQIIILSMRVVDSPADVMPALNSSVKCGVRDVHYSDCAVVRLVNADYFILYIPASWKDVRTAVEQNSAILYGRNVVSAKELHDVMMSIEDLKNRRGAQMCTKENYGGFKSTENEVDN